MTQYEVSIFSAAAIIKPMRVTKLMFREIITKLKIRTVFEIVGLVVAVLSLGVGIVSLIWPGTVPKALDKLAGVQQEQGKKLDNIEQGVSRLKREVSDDPHTQLANWGYQIDSYSFSASEAFILAVKSQRPEHAKTILAANFPISPTVFTKVKISYSLALELNEYRNLETESRSLCLHYEKVLKKGYFGTISDIFSAGNSQTFRKLCPDLFESTVSWANERSGLVQEQKELRVEALALLPRVKEDCVSYYSEKAPLEGIENKFVIWFKSNGERSGDVLARVDQFDIKEINPLLYFATRVRPGDFGRSHSEINGGLYDDVVNQISWGFIGLSNKGTLAFTKEGLNSKYGGKDHPSVEAFLKTRADFHARHYCYDTVSVEDFSHKYSDSNDSSHRVILDNL